MISNCKNLKLIILYCPYFWYYGTRNLLVVPNTPEIIRKGCTQAHLYLQKINKNFNLHHKWYYSLYDEHSN